MQNTTSILGGLLDVDAYLRRVTAFVQFQNLTITVYGRDM
jgi:hypothetical protein